MAGLSRRGFLTGVSAGLLTFGTRAASPKRPNILFAIADDWGYPYASAYGAAGISTPGFDRVASEGCLFTNAFVSAPQCSPNRASILTSRNIWQNEEAGTHASIFPNKLKVFPDLLEQAGYHIGCGGKGWGPGDWEKGGRKRPPAGPEYRKLKLQKPTKGVSDEDYAGNFAQFLEARADGAPFYYWYGGREPHRVYEPGSGRRAGKKIEDARVPPFLPDNPTVREDILDYLLEAEWFDRHLGLMLDRLDQIGELDTTLVVVTGDTGISFPGAKANLYEYGIHVPLAARWPERVAPGKTSEDLISCADLAPTFLDAAGVGLEPGMVGRSFLEGAGSEKADFIVTGRERHSHARYDDLGYPSRAIRTSQHLYIRNFKPDRWPAGDPEGYYDIDDSPTKTYMLEHRDEMPKLFAHSFGKRPEEELFDVRADPGCLDNLAGKPEHAEIEAQLSKRLMKLLEDQQDPRARGSEIFESYPRMSKMRLELGGFAEEGKYNRTYTEKE
ncbi:MAG: sulfatase [Candidatus Hydrogenedentes bacterium]|nr:sulfatase [Candidatus Hydrogenedentota bacterium]